MHIECLITKATKTGTQKTQRLLLFHCYNGCTNATQRYVIRTLSILFRFENSLSYHFHTYSHQTVTSIWLVCIRGLSFELRFRQKLICLRFSVMFVSSSKHF